MTTAPPPALLERDRELDHLREAWRRAQTGSGSTWLICAEAGGGKTHLLREAVPAHRRWGAAEPVSPPEPFLAIRQALPDFEPAASRVESVARAVAQLEARSGALALVLDDLHFADEGTVAVLVRLAALSASRPWLILAAARPDEGPLSLRRAFAELGCQGAARRLDLPPLSEEAVRALLAHVRGAAPEEDEVASVYRDSGGNPWFAQALARGAGAVTAARDRILLRLDRIEDALPGASTMLASLAPAGGPLPYAAVCARFGGDSPALRRLLRGLRDAGLLVEADDGAWQFRHELLRRSLLAEMIEPDRRDAHRLLAECLEGHASAAVVAMHYAAAHDPRTPPWALQAARQASYVDAHEEALAQLERALIFPMEPETRRTALRAASLQAHHLGRWATCRRLAEEALAIPGGEPESRSVLHRRAADAARHMGDGATAVAHMDAAEAVLAGRPVSVEMARVAAARVLQASVQADPVAVAARAERALRVAGALEDRALASIYEVEVRSYLGLSQLAAGDPAGFAPFEAIAALRPAGPEGARDVVIALGNVYTAAVLGLFHQQATVFEARLTDGLRRHNLGWACRARPYRALALVQRGGYDAARVEVQGEGAPPTAADGLVAALAALLLEVRAGSLVRAQRLLAALPQPCVFFQEVVSGLARLEVAVAAAAPDLEMLAWRLYERGEAHRCARLAGVAAVALAWAGRSAPPTPTWLADASPLRVFWDWAAGIVRRDGALLRDAADRLTAMECPYEAALALRDAGELAAAYQALRALGATTAREQVAALLRAADRPVPRRPRAAIERDGLTDTERSVCRLVAAGESNDGIALRLSVSPRTVEAHLTRVYQKTGRRGRAALAIWWSEREEERTRPTALPAMTGAVPA